MNIQDAGEKALRTTRIVRPRVHPLETYAMTPLPYVFLSESSVNQGDTVVRRGEIIVEKPSLVLPFNLPHFDGFKFEEEMEVNEDILTSFLLVRGISFPSLKYNNKSASIDIYEGRLSKAISHYGEMLQREENVHTGLLAGKEDVWQFAVLMFISNQVTRSADNDIKKLFEDFRKNQGL